MQELTACSEDAPDGTEGERRKPWTHLLRHHVTSDVAERARCLLLPPGDDSSPPAEECAAALWQLKQPQLRGAFAHVFDTPTTSCNNGWMRSKLLQALGLDPRWTPQQEQGRGQVPSPDPAASAVDPGGIALRPKRQRAAVQRLGQEPDATVGSQGPGGAGRGGGRKKRQGHGSSRLPPATSLRSAGGPGTPSHGSDHATAVPAAAAAATEPAQGGWQTASLPLPPPPPPPNWEQCKRLLTDSAHSLPLPCQLTDSAHSLPPPCRLSEAALSLPLPGQPSGASLSLPLPSQLSGASRSLPLPHQPPGLAGSALPTLAALQGLSNVQYIHVVLPLAAASQLMAGSAPQQTQPMQQPAAAPPAGAPSPQECLERYWQEQQLLERRRGQYQHGGEGGQGCWGTAPPAQQPPPGALPAKMPSSEPLAGGGSWQACQPLPAVCSLPLPPQLRAEQSMPPLLRAEQSMPPLLRAEQSMPLPQLGVQHSLPFSFPGQAGAHSLHQGTQRRHTFSDWMHHHQQLPHSAEQPPLGRKPQHWQQWQSAPLQPLQLPPSSVGVAGAHSQPLEFAPSCSLPLAGAGSLTPGTPLPDQQQQGHLILQPARVPAQEVQQLPLQPLAQALWQHTSLQRLVQRQCQQAEQQGQHAPVPAWQRQQVEQARQMQQVQQAQQMQQVLLEYDPSFADDLEALCSGCEPGIPAWPPEVPVPSA